MLKSGTPGSAPDAAHVGAAIAALGKGFRGKKVSIPQDARAGVKARVRAAWRKLHPDAKPEDLPSVLRAESADLDATHTYSTVQLVLDDAAASVLRQRAASIIAPAHVHPGEGLETRPHITVLYGLETDDVAEVLPLVGPSESPIEAVLQALEVFRPEGKDYDVLVHRVACPGAIVLHERLIGALAHVATHPAYQPHVTLGYVQRGLGGQYATLMTGLEGMVLTFWEVEFNSSEDVRTTIPLHLHAAIALEAMGVQLPSVENHPNRLPFEGVLTRVDEPSDRAPSGAQGHRVLMPRACAEAALPSLIGMGVGIDGSLEGHNPQRKIGVITEAWLSGQDLRVRGVLYARDFPQEITQIRALARQGLMGMSFELAAVEIERPEAPVWRLLRCTFTGAAILKRAHAAYRATALAAQGRETGENMDQVSGIPTSAAGSAVNLTWALAANAVEVVTLQANMDTLMQTMQQMGGQLEGYQACMQAMDRCIGMRGEMDGLVEALEHLVKMHQALHQMGGAAAVVAADADATILTAGQGEDMDADTKALLTQMAATQAELQAAVKLLTDGQQEIRGLLTDRQQGGAGLLTDSQGHLQATRNGLPVRRSLQAQGEYERCVQKYGLEREKAYTEREVDTVLRNAGITEAEKRLAVKLELQANGIMQ